VNTLNLTTRPLPALIIVGSIFPWANGAADEGLSDIEKRRLFEPTEAELRAESQGTIYIYNGLRDIDVQRALDDEFDRVEHMMFIRTRKTEPDGAAKRDNDTGEYEYEDDGC
jgi:hypothetical protein